MDYVRSCYKSSMRLYNDRPDVVVKGQWFFCQPGAKLAQMPHVFASQVWTPKGMAIDPPLGEVQGRGAWVDGKPDSRLIGQHFCGSPEVWLHGIPFADRPGLALEPDGTPVCCHAPPAVPTFTSGGDLAIDATAEGDAVYSGAKAETGNLLPLSVDRFDAVFARVLWDTDAYFDLGSNAALLTPPRDGVYLVGVEVSCTWLGAPDSEVTVTLLATDALGDAVHETSAVFDQHSITTVDQSSPAVQVRLHAALPLTLIGFILGGLTNLVDVRAKLWAQFLGNPAPVFTPLVTSGGAQLVTGGGDPLVAQS
jgi:hypothetical protein